MKKLTWIILILFLALLAHQAGKEIGCRQLEKKNNMSIECHSQLFKGR